jgi:hypothetical protein
MRSVEHLGGAGALTPGLFGGRACRRCQRNRGRGRDAQHHQVVARWTQVRSPIAVDLAQQLDEQSAGRRGGRAIGGAAFIASTCSAGINSSSEITVEAAHPQAHRLCVAQR